MSMRAHLTAANLEGQTLVDADVDDVELRSTLSWRIGDVRQAISMAAIGQITITPPLASRALAVSAESEA